MDRAEREADELAWVSAHRSLVDIAFEAFMATGTWPPVQRVQRDLDRAEESINIEQALTTMPRLPGEQRAYVTSTVTLPLRLLWHVPEAHPVLDACLAIVLRARTLYFSDAEDLEVTSNDETLLTAAGGDVALLRRARDLVLADYPNPFAGGGSSDNGWSARVNEAVARQLSGVESVQEYFDRQAEICEAVERERGRILVPHDVVAEPSDLFVLMPFGEKWAAVYEMIRDAGSLADENLRVYRADDITTSDYITHQIMGAIRSADAVLAVVSSFNPNVMWELGFAYALEKPLVMLNDNVDDAPFDVRTFRQVTYSTPPTEAELRRIANHILGALGRDPI